MPPDCLRYIGVTGRALAVRLDQHVADSLLTDGTHKRHWLRAALDAGRTVEIELLDTASASSDALWLERLWIAVYRACGVPLVNAIDGGRGCLNPTRETRRKMRDSHLGKKDTVATRQKKSLAHKGQPYPTNRKRRVITEAFRDRMRQVALARPAPSEAEKNRLRNMRAGVKHSIDTRIAMSQSQKLRWQARKGSALTCR